MFMDIPRQELMRRILAAVFVAGALYATVVGSLWLMTDFIATSVYSPNLDEAQQVADFNDLAYISQSLRGYRFQPGAEALIMAIALMALAVAVVNRDNARKPIYIAGGVALACEALLLSHGFVLSYAVLFAATAIALFLATELCPATILQDEAEIVDDSAEVQDEGPPGGESERTATAVGERAEPEAVVPVLFDDSDNESRREPVLPEPEGDEVIVIDHDEVADTASVDALGLEIDSDMNLDLEPDYQLARGAVEEDPLVLLSQADLGIEDEPTIETAADIEREVGVDVSLDLASTAEIKAFIGLADEDAIEGEATAVGQDAETASTAESENEAAEDVSVSTVAPTTSAHILQDKPVTAATTESDMTEEPDPVILTAVENGGEAKIPIPEFDPEELAHQEKLLPPPRQKVWNLLDWSILAVITLSIIALVIYYR